MALAIGDCDANETPSPVRPSDATRQAILDQARALLASQGPRGKWTVLDVCRRAGISRATFYVYFEGREHLLSACIRQLMQKVVHQVAEVKTMNIFESMMTYARLLRPGSGSLEMERTWGLIEILEAVQFSDDLRADYADLIGEVRERVIDQVRANQANGTIEPSLDPQGIGGILNGILFSGALFSQLGVPLRPDQVFGVLQTVLAPRR
jgi:AcrR family transcriptional regulator